LSLTFENQTPIMINLFDAEKDYYSVLGVAQACELSVIKAAFRKLAKQYHPDVSNHPLATSRFQEVSEAYEVLSRHRQAYDAAVLSLSQAAQHAQQKRRHARQNSDNRNEPTQNQHSSEQFDHWTEQTGRGRDRNMVYPLTLKYAFRLLREGSFMVPSLNTFLPFDSSALSNKEFRFPGKGFPSLFGGPAGDYIVSFKLTHHAPFKIRGGDLYMLIKVPLQIWKTGGEIYYDTPSGLFKVNIAKEVKEGSYIRFKNKGLPADRYQPGGHLYAKVTLE
jgi:curved DNA-binding protein